MAEETALHTKYRPRTLSEVIGHKEAVTKLQGFIRAKKYPNALLFLGPSSAGKTTLARAFAADVLGKAIRGNSDFTEMNMADKRTIDDVRGLLQVASLMPQGRVRRFLLLDEFQSVLSSPAAASALLTPIESPAATTTWMLCSMDPDKFASTQNGRAIANRCTQFHLKRHTEEDLLEQLKRIKQGEGYTFWTKSLTQAVLDNCNGEMRTLANVVQGIAAYYDGLDKKPEKLSAESVQEVLQSMESQDDRTAVRYLTAVYAGKFVSAQKEVLNVDDGFGFINKVMYLSGYILNDLVLNGVRHPKVWGTSFGKQLQGNLEELESYKKLERPGRIALAARVHNAAIQAKAQAQAFAVPEQQLLTSLTYTLTLDAKHEGR